MTGRPAKKIPTAVGQKELAKLRRTVTKSIDDFKEKILDSLTVAKEQGPLGESLLPDSATVNAAEIVHEVVQEELLYSIDAIQLVKPVRIEEINLPMINMIHPDVAPVVENIMPVTRQGGQLRVFVTGLDNQINSSMRVFLQKLGLETYNAHGERPNSEFIVEQFQLHNNQFDFAVVVLSPEEVMCQKFQTLEQGLWVTRQETIFELGFLVGKLGKGRVAVIYEEGPTRFKRPTEYFDLLYTPFDTTGLWQKRLINQLYTHGLIKEVSLVSA